MQIGSQATFKPALDSAVSRYFYAVANNGGPVGCNTSTSAVFGRIDVYSAPTITLQPRDTSYCSINNFRDLTTNAAAVNITGTTIGYRWYRQNINLNQNGTVITAGVNNNSLQFLKDLNYTEGVNNNYYYVRAYLTGINLPACDSVSSGPLPANIRVYVQPTIDSMSNYQNTSYCLNFPSRSFVANIKPYTNNLLNYQWYKSYNSTIGSDSLLPNTNNANFAPYTDSANVRYYYVVITNNQVGNLSGCVTTSNISGSITVIEAPIVSNLPTMPATGVNYCSNSSGITPLTVTYTGPLGSTPTYIWESSTRSDFSQNVDTVQNVTTVVNQNSYTPRIVPANTYYYRVRINIAGVINTGCPSSIISNVSYPINNYTLPNLVPMPLMANTYCINTSVDLVNTLRVNETAVGPAPGTNKSNLTYQWYRSSDNVYANGVAVVAANATSFKPTVAEVDTSFYYIVATNGFVGCRATSDINLARIAVFDTPTITAVLNGGRYCINNTTPTWTINVTPLRPDMFIWYRDDNNTGRTGTQIATGDNYQPRYTVAGRSYYYFTILYNDAIGCNRTSGYSGAVDIYAKPSVNVVGDFTTLKKYCAQVGSRGDNLIVSTNNNGLGTLNYTWYKSYDNVYGNDDAVSVPPTSTNQYGPPTDSSVSRYYYVIVNNGSGLSGLGGCDTAMSLISGRINVYSAPTISLVTPNNLTYCSSETIAALTVSAAAVNTTDVPAGLQYQWFKNTTASTSLGTRINNVAIGSNASNLTPQIDNVVINNAATNYFYAVAYLGNGLVCDSVRSSLITLNVYVTPTVTNPTTASITYCQNANPAAIQALRVIASLTPSGGNADLKYTWYRNTRNDPNQNTPLLETTDSLRPNTNRPLNDTSTYYVIVYNKIPRCADTSNNSGNVIIKTLPAVSSIDGTSYQYCVNEIPANVTTIAAPNFGGATLTYDWYDSNALTQVSTRLTVSGDLSPPTNVVGARYYRVVANVTGLVGCPTNSISSNLSGRITIYGKPRIVGTSGFGAVSYCQTFEPGRILVTSFDIGVIGDTIWTWYRAPNSNSPQGATDALAIQNALRITNENRGETSNSLLPRTSNIDTVRYFVILSNGATAPNLRSCSADTSDLTGNIIVNPIPLITRSLRTRDTFVCISEAIKLSLRATANGPLAYKWYRIRTQPNGMKDTLTTLTEPTDSFTQLANSAGVNVGDTIRYYVVVTLAGQCFTVSEVSGRIIITGNPSPGIVNSFNARYCQGNQGSFIKSTGQQLGQGGGSFEYLWQISFDYNPNTSMGNFTTLLGESSDSLKPNTNNVGDQYYRIIYTQANGGCKTTSAVSAPIVVNLTPQPLSITKGNKAQCQSNTLLSTDTFYATFSKGRINNYNYQWYYFETQSGEEAYKRVITGQNYTVSASQDTSIFFVPSRFVFDTIYFRVIVIDGNTCTSTSQISGQYIVLRNPTIESFTRSGDTAYCVNQPSNIGSHRVTASGAGTLTYNWYKAPNIIDTGIDITTPANRNGDGVNNLASTSSILVSASDSSYYYAKVTQQVGNCSFNTLRSSLVLVYGQPAVSIDQSANQLFCQYQTSTPLTTTLNLTNGRVGRITYQWYNNGSNSVLSSGAPSVVGAITSSYAPPTNAVGSFYYYVIINNGGPMGCNMATSLISPNVLVLAKPTIDAMGQPNVTTQTLCQRTNTFVLSVNGSSNNGNNLTYRWFSTKNDQRSGFTEILVGGDAATLVVPTNLIDTNQYFVIINNGADPRCANDTSNLSGKIFIRSSPLISASNQDRIYCKNDAATTLNITATPGAVSLNVVANIQQYQWFRNTNNLRSPMATRVFNNASTTATTSSYTPVTNVADTFWYYVVATNTNNCTDTSVSFARLQINTKPFSVRPQSAVYKYCQADGPTNSMIVYDTISVRANVNEEVPSNQLTYAWYKSKTPTFNVATPIESAVVDNNPTITKYFSRQFDINVPDSFYYYVISTNAWGCSDTTMLSTYFEVASQPIIAVTPPSVNRRYCYVAGNASDGLSFTRIAGTVPNNYTWYRDTNTIIVNSYNGVPVVQNVFSYNPPLQNPPINKGIYGYYIKYLYGTANCYDSTAYIAFDTVFNSPSFTMHPNPTPVSYCLNANQNALSIAVNANGGYSQALTYQWFVRDLIASTNTMIPGQTSLSYTPPNNDPIGVKQYYVIAYNGSGLSACNNTTSNLSGFDTVYTTPVLTLTPISRSLCVSDNVVNLLAVAATANKPGNPLFYQWYFTYNSTDNQNGTPLSGATTTTYTPSTLDTSKRYYYVVVTNGGLNASCNTVRSAAGTNVTVNPKPQITPETGFSVNRNYCQNLTSEVIPLKISVKAGPKVADNPLPTVVRYEWYNASRVLQNQVTPVGMSNTGMDSLFPNISTVGANTYYVVVYNENCRDSSTNSGIITVNSRPSVMDTANFRNTRLYCINTPMAGVSPLILTQVAGLTYRWYVKSINDRLASGGTPTNFVSSTLYPPTNVRGTYFYYLEVANGSCINYTPLSDSIIISAPNITTQPDANRVVITLGQPLVPLSVQVVETRVKYQWNVAPDSSYLSASRMSIQGATLSSYLPSNTLDGTSYYWVNVTDTTTSCVNSSNISGARIVQAPPVITMQPGVPGFTNATYCKNDVINFTVVANLNGATGTSLEYRWYRCTGSQPTYTDTVYVGSNATYNVPSSTPGLYYYFVKVLNRNSRLEVNSIFDTVRIYSAPIITTNSYSSNFNNPTNYCLNNSPAGILNLRITNTIENNFGVIKNHWYKTKMNSYSGYELSTTTRPSLFNDARDTIITPAVDTTGAYYYYAVYEIAAAPIACRYTTSNLSGVIRVYNKPRINAQISNAAVQYCINVTSTPLTITASLDSNVGTLTYRWFKISNITNYKNTTTGEIMNEIFNSIAPITSSTDSSFYYTVLSNSSGLAACDTSVSILGGNIKVYNNPVIITDINNADINYCTQALGGIPTNLIVTSNTAGGIGNLSYQWFKTTVGQNSGGSVYGNAQRMQAPDVSSPQTSYYYLVIDNNTIAGASCRYTTSRVSGKIAVYTSPVITNDLNYRRYPQSLTFCQGERPDTISVVGNTGGTGTLKYVWYRNSSQNNSTGNRYDSNTTGIYYPSSNFDTALYYYAVLNNGGPANCSMTPTRVSGLFTVNTGATITLGPTYTTPRNYCENQMNVPDFDISVTTKPGSTISYSWYYTNTAVTTGGTKISGPNSSVGYAPPVDSVNLGSRYYYMVATVTFSGTVCESPTPNPTGQVSVFALPRITAQPNASDISYCINNFGYTPLAITASIPINSAGVVNHQWYVNSIKDTANASIISGATSTTRTPSNVTAGNFWYFDIIRNSANGACQTTSSLSGRISVYASPIISPEIVNSTNYDYCINTPPDQILPISIGAQLVNNIGTLSYKWYKKTNTSPNAFNGWQVLSDADGTIANETTIYPNVDTNAIRRYYVVVDNGYNGAQTGCRYTTSNITGRVSTYAIPTIQATNFNSSQDTFYIVNDVARPLTITGSLNGGPGTVNYTWFRNSLQSTSGATQLNSGSNLSSFSPPTNVSDSSYYYVVIDNQFPATGIGSNCRVANPYFSGKVIVYNRITITPVNLAGTSYCRTSSAPDNSTPLSITANANGLGTLTYQWYRNTTNSNTGGVAVPGATSNTYTPDQSIVRTLYYYVVVTNVNIPAINQARWQTSSVSGAINVYSNPTITKQVSDTNRTYCQFDPNVISLNVVANNSGLGSINYSWYSNTIINQFVGSILVVPASESATTYQPDNSVTGTKYYYVIVTNPGAPEACKYTTSNFSGFYLINPGATISNPVNFSSPFNYCKNQSSGVNTLSVTAQGTNLEYQWFANSQERNTGGWAISNLKNIGANSNAITPDVDSVLVRYYYIVVTDRNGAACSTTSAVSRAVNVFGVPAINSSSLVARDYCVNAFSTFPLNISASLEAAPSTTVAINYQWYSDTVFRQTSANAISTGVGLNTINPNVSVASKRYYYAILRNNSNQNCVTTSALSGLIQVFASPVVTIAPEFLQNKQVCVNQDFNLTANASLVNNVGTLGYTWYYCDDASFTNSVAVQNSNNSSITTRYLTASSKYYYITVTNGGPAAACNISTSSLSGRFDVYATPTVTAPTGAVTICQYAPINQLPITSVQATTGGTGVIRYQWYQTEVQGDPGVGGFLIPNQTATFYQPDADTVGSFYYYVVIANGGPATCNIKTSATSGLYKINSAARIVQQPSSNPGIVEYCQNPNNAVAGVTPLTISATTASGNVPTYNWFKTEQRNTNSGYSVANGLNNNYTPQIDSAIDIYYYVVVNNTEGGVTCGTTSNLSSQFKIYAQPSVTSGANFSSNVYCLNDNTDNTRVGVNVSFTKTKAGATQSINYQWYLSSVYADTTTGNAIIDGSGSQATYGPSTTTAGRRYYYVVASNALRGTCNAKSFTTLFKDVFERPIIDSLDNRFLTARSYCRSDLDADSLKVYASFPGQMSLGGNLSYQWLRGTVNDISSLSSISGGVGYGIRPYTTSLAASSYYLAVIISNPLTAPLACRTNTSLVSGKIDVYVPPTTNPAGQNYSSNWNTALTTCNPQQLQNFTGPNPTLQGFSNLPLRYQWYRNSRRDTIGGITIDMLGANNAVGTIQPGTSTPAIFYRPVQLGTWFYYYIITNDAAPEGCKTAISLNVSQSVTAGITINQAPVITYPSDFSQPQTVCQTTSGSSARSFSITVDPTSYTGNISYTWYKNNTSTFATAQQNQTNANDGSGRTTASFTPSTTIATTVTSFNRYFFVVVSASNCATTSNATGLYTVDATPAIIAQNNVLNGNVYCNTETANTLKVGNNFSGSAFNYQWFSSFDSTNAYTTSVAETFQANDSFFVPQITTASRKYYYITIANANNTSCRVTSGVSGAIISYAEPVIFNQPSAAEKKYCFGASLTDTDSLKIQATNGGYGTISYKWVRYTSPLVQTDVPNSNSSGFLPRTDAVGEASYYAVVSNGSPKLACATRISSNSGLIKVYRAPVITTNVSPNPQSNLCQYSTPVSLFISDNNGGYGTNTYQWFSSASATNVGGVSLDGQTRSSYTPSTLVSNTRLYYYVVVNNGGPANCGVTASSVSGEVFVSPSPVITTQPNNIDQGFCQGGTAEPFNIVVNQNNGGVTTAQWFGNSNRSFVGSFPVNGATSISFSPPTLTSGQNFYYAIVTNTSNCSDTSDFSGIVSVSAQPSIESGNQPLSFQAACQNISSGVQILSAFPRDGVGTPTYQWYYNNTNSVDIATATRIDGANFASYNPSVATTGTRYYFVNITYPTASCNPVKSNTATVVVNAFPSITNNVSSASANYCVNDLSVTNLSVTAQVTGGGTLNFQWYENNVSNTSNAQAIAGVNARGTNYTPLVNTASQKYYFVVVSNSIGAFSCAATSNVSGLVSVFNLPTIDPSGQPSGIDQNYVQNQDPTPLTVTVNPGSGTFVGYQWYKASQADYNSGEAVQTLDATSAQFKPITTTISDNYYFVVANNENNLKACYVTSNFSGLIRVINSTSIFIPDSITAYNYCQFTVPAAVVTYSFALSSGSATRIQWFQNTSKTYLGATRLPNDTLLSFNPITTSIGTYYYFVVVTTSNGSVSTSNFTGAVSIISSPTFNLTPPSEVKYCVNGVAQPLVYTTTGSSQPVFTWFINSQNANVGGTPIPGETDGSYTPTVNLTGVRYYYVTAVFNGGGGSCNSIIGPVVAVQVYQQPTISSNPVTTATYCQGNNGQPAAAITFTASNGGYGNNTIRWYKRTNSQSAQLIPNETLTTYIPSTAAIDTSYYFATLENGGQQGCNTVQTTESRVIISGSPVITRQPDSAQYDLNANTVKALSVDATTGGGILTYRWFSSPVRATVNGAFTDSTRSSFVPKVNSLGITYYYVVLDNGTSAACRTVTSIAVPVKVFAQPQIVVQPKDSSYCNQGITVPLLVRIAPVTGIRVYYQWYSNSLNNTNSGIAINGATDSFYTPTSLNPSAAPITTYYYCVITNDGPDGVNRAVTRAAAIIVDNLNTFSLNFASSNSQTVCRDGTALPITLSASSATQSAISSLMYRWYESTVKTNSGGTLITNPTNGNGTAITRYTPSTSNIGTKYYYVIASGNFNNQTKCNTITSAIATLNVFGAPIVTKNISDTSYCSGEVVKPLEISYLKEGTRVSINWFRNTSKSTIGAVNLNSYDTIYRPENILDSIIYYAVLLDSASIPGCNTTYTNFAAVNISSKPVLTNSTVNFCSGQPINITLNSSVINTRITWIRYPNVRIQNDTARGVGIINETIVDTSGLSDPLNITYYVDLVAPKGCANLASPYIITINPTPQVKNVGVDRRYCVSNNGSPTVTEPLNIELTISSASVNWRQTNPTIGLNAANGIGTIPSFTINQSINRVTYDTFRAIPVLGICVGRETDVAYYSVSPSIGNLQARLQGRQSNTVCQGSNPNLRAFYPTGGLIQGTRYTWTKSLTMNGTYSGIGTTTDTLFRGPIQTDSVAFYRVIAEFGCAATSNILAVRAIYNPIVRILPSTNTIGIVPNSSISFTADIIDTVLGIYKATRMSYLWSDSLGTILPSDENNVSQTFLANRISNTNKFTVTATSLDNSCEASSSIRVVVNDSILYPLISTNNILTPNGDNRNDVFEITDYSTFRSRGYKISFKLFNSFGKELLSEVDNFSRWDGTIDGQTVNTGIYYFNIIVTKDNTASGGGENDLIIKNRGTITVITN